MRVYELYVHTVLQNFAMELDAMKTLYASEVKELLNVDVKRGFMGMVSPDVVVRCIIFLRL